MDLLCALHIDLNQIQTTKTVWGEDKGSVRYIRNKSYLNRVFFLSVQKNKVFSLKKVWYMVGRNLQLVRQLITKDSQYSNNKNTAKCFLYPPPSPYRQLKY